MARGDRRNGGRRGRDAGNPSRWAHRVLGAPNRPYLTGDRALVAEAHAWLADRSMVAVTPTGPYVEATLADPRAAYIAIRTVTPGATWQGDPRPDPGPRPGP